MVEWEGRGKREENLGGEQREKQEENKIEKEGKKGKR